MLKYKGMIFIFIAFLVLNFASAQLNIPGQDQIDKFQENVNEFSDSPSDYLKQEWTKFFEKSAFGRFFINIDNSLNKFNAIFYFVLDLEFSWSWLFFITLVLWIAFVIYFYKFSKIIFILPSLDKIHFLNILLFLFSLFIISLTGVPLVIADFFVSSIGKIDSFSTQIIAAAGFIIVLLLLSVYSRIVDKILKNLKKSREEARIKSEVKESKRARKQLFKFWKVRSESEEKESEEEDIEKNIRKGLTGES